MAEIDQCWADLAEQIKVVRDNKNKIEELEKQLDAEVEVKEGSADTLQAFVSEY